MDDGESIGRDIVALGPNITHSVQSFAQTQRSLPDDFDRGPDPLLCFSLADENSFQKQPGGGDPLAVMAWRRWSKVCGRYILFAESFDDIPDDITQPVADGGYGIKKHEELVILTPKKHSTQLKSWEKYA